MNRSTYVLAEIEGRARLDLNTALTSTHAKRFHFNAGLAPIVFHFVGSLDEGNCKK
jgi:hypothetical protein